MIIRTRVFELCPRKYKNLSELAQAMGISVSQIYRVREGRRNINQKFVIGAVKAFPECKLDELFYLALKGPTGKDNYEHQYSVPYPPHHPPTNEKPIVNNRVELVRKFYREKSGAVI